MINPEYTGIIPLILFQDGAVTACLGSMRIYLRRGLFETIEYVSNRQPLCLLLTTSYGYYACFSEYFFIFLSVIFYVCF